MSNLPSSEVKAEEERIRAHYDRADYSADTEALERSVFADFRKFLFQFAPQDGLFLEIAPADGKNLPYYPPGSSIHAVDLSAKQLAAAKERATSLGISLETHVTSVHEMPFDRGDFDAVVCTLGLCTIPNPEQALREIKRVVRPHGKLFVMEHVYPKGWAMRAFCHCIQPLAAWKMPGCCTTRDTVGSIERSGWKIVERKERFNGLLVALVCESI